MQHLNPTLWRTCKMLAGRARIRLLRQLHDHPEECVSALGKRVALKEAAASQELRRIQSRGLLQAERRGVRLVYRLAADPQVASAAPLLKALQTAFDACPAERDADMVAIAAGLAHERRIRIVRTLLEGRRTRLDLQYATRISPHPFRKHLEKLAAGGFIVAADDSILLAVPNHPLAKALVKLIRQGAAS